MILEGLVTTTNADGSINLAPMGPVVNETLTAITLRPFCSSQTFLNLQRNPQCVLHITDDVLLMARAAIHQLDEPPPLQPAMHIAGQMLTNCCRWFELEVANCTVANERAVMEMRIVHVGWNRDFFGFNRARHAVLEAAILATRIHLIPAAELRRQLNALRSPVEKTAGPAEVQAYELLVRYVESQLKPSSCG